MPVFLFTVLRTAILEGLKKKSIEDEGFKGSLVSCERVTDPRITCDVLLIIYGLNI